MLEGYDTIYNKYNTPNCNIKNIQYKRGSQCLPH